MYIIYQFALKAFRNLTSLFVDHCLSSEFQALTMVFLAFWVHRIFSSLDLVRMRFSGSSNTHGPHLAQKLRRVHQTHIRTRPPPESSHGIREVMSSAFALQLHHAFVPGGGLGMCTQERKYTTWQTTWHNMAQPEPGFAFLRVSHAWKVCCHWSLEIAKHDKMLNVLQKK